MVEVVVALEALLQLLVVQVGQVVTVDLELQEYL